MNTLNDLSFCVRWLVAEHFNETEANAILRSLDNNEDALFQTYRNLVNVRTPAPTSHEFIAAQDRMLKQRIARLGITDAAQLPRVPSNSHISLWRGDITTLKVDAIVNAANSQMLGCWTPGHNCIDNAIHTFAGVQLREECDRIMKEQGHPEPTGKAKVTPAFNLPARWIIHTVGPIVNGKLGPRHCELLRSSYTNCLSAAQEIGTQSIAFCCISTGVFGFPHKAAATLAVQTVKEWLNGYNSNMHVIFDVFAPEDEELYHELLF